MKGAVEVFIGSYVSTVGTTLAMFTFDTCLIKIQHLNNSYEQIFHNLCCCVIHVCLTVFSELWIHVQMSQLVRQITIDCDCK